MHIFENAEKFNIDPKRIAFLGDSSGYLKIV
jgi:acetyl esterase/lipase